MLDIKNIVVPYDFSKRCRAAAGHAVVLSRRFSAPITLLHIIPYSSFEYAAFEGGSYVGTAWPSEDDVLSRLRTEMESIDAPDEEKKDWEVEVFKGEPPLRIAEFVAQVESPLVVMPTHGHGAFRRFVLGSVTAKSLHDLKCPILTGVHLEDQSPFVVKAYGHVACAVDVSEHSLQTLRFAMDFAGAWDAKLTALHASTWFSSVEADEAMLPPTMRKQLIDTSKGEVAALLREIDCGADMRVGFGRPEDFVPRMARELNVDVLVVGRTQEGGVGFRSRAYELIRSAPCPVLSV